MSCADAVSPALCRSSPAQTRLSAFISEARELLALGRTWDVSTGWCDSPLPALPARFALACFALGCVAEVPKPKQDVSHAVTTAVPHVLAGVALGTRFWSQGTSSWRSTLHGRAAMTWVNFGRGRGGAYGQLGMAGESHGVSLWLSGDDPRFCPVKCKSES